MTVQDLPKFEAFEEWEVQLAPGKKPKAMRKSAAAAPVAPEIVAVKAELKILRRVVKRLVSFGRWVVDGVWEAISEWFKDLRRRIFTFVLSGLVGGGGVAHVEFDLFGLQHAPPSAATPVPASAKKAVPTAANDNADPWHTVVHRETKVAGTRK